MNRLTLFALNGGQALIIALAMTAAMVLAAWGVVDKTMTIGDFVLINAFRMQIFMPLNFLGFVYREMKGAMANIESMFALLDQQPRVVNAPDDTALVVTRGEVRFEDVTLGYGPERGILRGVSFTVPARHKVAIVGSSGAGKSTLLKILFRFHDPDAGRVIVDGQDIRQVTLDSLRRAIGVRSEEHTSELQSRENL